MSRFSSVALATSGLLAWATVSAPALAACQAVSGAQVPAVVELYTSEGCSSCPPADRWLSTLKGRPDVITLGYHVDYWDNLGWKDRFAQPLFSQRQAASIRSSGARFAYTPQILVNGRDTPEWSALPPASLAMRPGPTIRLALEQRSTGLALSVTPLAGAPARTSGFLAVVDDGLQSRVGAGENRGATLHHDGVVREFLPWTANGAQTLEFSSAATLEPGASRHWVAVATDEAGRPLQALALACPR